MVQRLELDLAVGDVVQIGEMTVTVIDIENGEVTFRIDDGNHQESDSAKGFADEKALPLPR